MQLGKHGEGPRHKHGTLLGAWREVRQGGLDFFIAVASKFPDA